MKVLIVDDLHDARQVLRYMVVNNGHEALEAINGSDALTIANGTPPDLIISDALMPVMDGFQLLRSIKQDPELVEFGAIGPQAYAPKAGTEGKLGHQRGIDVVNGP